MKRISLLLLFFLFISCAGQHRAHQQIKYSHLKNHDCKTLFKKQKLQYNLAIREGKANQRRRKTALFTVQKNEVATEKAALASTYRQKNISVDVASPHLFAPRVPIENIDLFVPIIPVNAVHLTSTETNSQGPQLQKKIIKEDVRSSHFISSGLPVMLFGVAGLAGMGLLKLFEKKAQQISRYGRKNPWKIRGYIGATQIGMGLTSLWLGHSLYTEGIMIPEYARLSTLGLFAVAAIFYPSGNYDNGFPTFSYLQRKFHDAALFTTGAMLTVYAGNHCQITLQPTDSSQTVARISEHEEKIFSVKFAKRKISLVKNDFQAKLKTHFEDPKKSRTQGEKIALTIIVSLGFALLTAGVAAASCSLSCSGNEVAAVAVLIGGAALIVWGLSTALKSIHRYPTIEKKRKVQPST